MDFAAASCAKVNNVLVEVAGENSARLATTHRGFVGVYVGGRTLTVVMSWPRPRALGRAYLHVPSSYRIHHSRCGTYEQPHLQTPSA